MKKLLLGLLFCGMAHADSIATLNNKAGGMIVLTDVPCKNDMGFYSYASSQTSSTQFGCWWSDDTMIHIVWLADKDLRSYPISAFTVNIEKATKLKKNQERY